MLGIDQSRIGSAREDKENVQGTRNLRSNQTQILYPDEPETAIIPVRQAETAIIPVRQTEQAKSSQS